MFFVIVDGTTTAEDVV